MTQKATMNDVMTVVEKTGQFYVEQQVSPDVGVTAMAIMISAAIAMLSVDDPAKGAELHTAIVSAITNGSVAMAAHVANLDFAGVEGEAA